MNDVGDGRVDGGRADGRVWFVTGSSRGMGRTLATCALERGDRVVATARNVEPLTALCDRFPERVLAVRLDVGDEAMASVAVQRAVERFGRIDAVFNNAGYSLLGSVEGTSEAQAKALFDTHVFGVLNVLRAVLPVMRAQRSGHVFQMSSIFGHMSFPGSGILAAAKHAVEGMSEALALELAPLGVHVTVVEPHALDTTFLSRTLVAKRIPDYDETVGPVLDLLGALPPEALTSTARVAEAILEVASLDDPPLRLALGRGAEDEIRRGLTTRLEEVEDWRPVTRAVDRA